MQKIQGSQDEAAHGRTVFGLAFTPSLLSGTLCILISLVAVGGIIASQIYASSPLHQQVNDWLQTDQMQLLVFEYGSNYDAEAAPVFNQIFLAIFWGFIGLMVYFVLLSIYIVFHRARQLDNELLHYANVNRRAFIMAEVSILAVRAASLATWLALIFASPRIWLYAFAMARLAASELLSVGGALYTIGAIVLLTVWLHLGIVCLRLVLLRPRVFGGENLLVR